MTESQRSRVGKADDYDTHSGARPISSASPSAVAVNISVTALAGLCFLLWMSYLTLPYVPFPTDDVRFHDSIFNFDAHYDPFPLAAILLRYGALTTLALSRSIKLGIGSYDALAITQMIYAAALGASVYLLTIRLSANRLASTVACILTLTSAWTAEYVFVVSHATITALIFVLALWAACDLCDAIANNKNPTVSATIFFSFLSALPLVSSSGLFWFAAATVWVCCRGYGICSPINKSLLVIHRHWLSFVPAAAVSLIAFTYWALTWPERHQQLYENVHSNSLRYTTVIFGEHLTTLPFTLAKVLYQRQPILIVCVILVAATVCWRWLAKNLSKLERCIIIPLLLTFAFCYGAGELNPYTKLARSYFPLICLIVVTPCVSISEYIDRRALIVLASAVVAVGLYRTEMGARFRFSLYHAIRRVSTKSAFLKLRDDPHAMQIGRAVTLSLGHTFGVPNIAERPDHYVAIVGPRGPRNGRSVTESCELPNFHPENSVVPRGANVVGTFLFPGYYPYFQVEEETCENLYLRGQTPDPYDPQNMVTVWIVTRPSGGWTNDGMR